MLLITDSAMQNHRPGAGHPEAPARLAAAVTAVEDATGVTWATPRPAEQKLLLRVHPLGHVDRMEGYRGRSAQIDADTATSPESIHAAYLAAGSVIDAVDAVIGGEHQRAFALVRPPGHHAEPQSAMGFCFFNSIAVGAAHAVHDHGCERVLIVDWDVHHGNGTQAAFEGRADVLFVSLHQFPFYPGTGALLEIGTGPGEGYTVNIPLPSRCTDGDYRAAFRDVVAPIARAFDPDLVMVSAGFDAHRLDPLASMRVTEEGFADMAATVLDIAERHAGGRLVLTLEGGYDLGALGRSVRSVVDVLTGTPAPGGAPKADRGARVIEHVIRQHRDRWSL